jgi:hypothetical protein
MLSFAFAIVATVATGNRHTAGQAQTSLPPAGTLAFGAFTSEFRADGTFVIEGSIDDVGSLRATSQWRVERDIAEFVGWNMTKGFEFTGSTPAECDKPGRYRFTVDASHVLFERVADDCQARRTLLDGDLPAAIAGNRQRFQRIAGCGRRKDLPLERGRRDPRRFCRPRVPAHRDQSDGRATDGHAGAVSRHDVWCAAPIACSRSPRDTHSRGPYLASSPPVSPST